MYQRLYEKEFKKKVEREVKRKKLQIVEVSIVIVKVEKRIRYKMNGFCFFGKINDFSMYVCSLGRNKGRSLYWKYVDQYNLVVFEDGE